MFPDITVDEDGVIYIDGEILTEAIKNAKNIAEADHQQAASDHTTAVSDHSAAESDHSRAEEDHTRAEADHESIANKADIDGSYDTMSVGMAKNLEGKSIVTESFLERTSGGDAEIANGLGALQGVEGNSQVWNQLLAAINAENYTAGGKVTISDGALVYTGTGSGWYQRVNLANSKRFDVIAGHKYLLSFDVPVNTITSNTLEYFGFGTAIDAILGYVRLGNTTGHKSDIITVNTSATVVCVGFSSSAGNPIAEGETASVKNVQLTDLTLLGIDNLTTVEEVEAWLAENIGEQAYYPYEPGTVLNANLEGVESSGFNLLDPATGKAELIGTYSDVYDSYYGITGTHGAMTFTDRYGNTETITPDEEGKFLIEKDGTLTVASAGDDCAVFIWWDGTRTEFEPYEMNVGDLDVKHIYGKLDGEGDYVQVWPTGMPGINGINDTLKLENGEVVARRNLGEVDLGNSAWQSDTLQGIVIWKRYIVGGIGKTMYLKSNILCHKYINVAPVDLISKGPKSIRGQFIQSPTYELQVVIYDDTFADYTSTQVQSALSGVLLYYELITPKVYTDLIYQGSSLFADGTPVTLPVNYKVNNWGIERVLPKNTSEVTATAKTTLTCRYSIDAVEQIDTMQTEIEHLDESKPNKYGDYPDMAVGSARALAGNNKQLEDFVFTDINVADGIAKLDSVRGKSLVWNQLFLDNVSTVTHNGITFSWDATNHCISFSGTGTGAYAARVELISRDFIVGHKYYYRHNVIANPNNISTLKYGLLNQSNVGGESTDTYYRRILTAEGTGRSWGVERTQGVDMTGIKIVLDLVDLTLMFGAGNEPTTVEEFEKLFPQPYYDYNAGNIKNNMTTAVKFTGFNQWDEEWELGAYNTATGQPVVHNDQIRAKNYIPVFSNTNYYIQAPYFQSQSYSALWCTFFDADKNVIDATGIPQKIRSDGNSAHLYGLFTTPSNAAYMKFYAQIFYGTTYNHDICINLSDANRNGEYEPHKETIVQLNLPTLTGKLTGEGESVVVFPDGMRAAGSAYDEIVGNKAVVRFVEVDMGDLDWGLAMQGGHSRFQTPLANMYHNGQYEPIQINTYGYISRISPLSSTPDDLTMAHYNGMLYVVNDAYSDAVTFKAAMAGVKLIYELETPLEYTLDTPLPETFQAYKGGTMMQLPQNGSAPTTAPMVMECTYAIDAVGILTGLPQNYISKESLQAMLGAMQSAGLFASYTMTFDETNNRYSFTFTPNPTE